MPPLTTPTALPAGVEQVTSTSRCSGISEHVSTRGSH